MAHISDCKTFFQNFMDLENICCRFYGRGYFFLADIMGLRYFLWRIFWTMILIVADFMNGLRYFLRQILIRFRP